MHDNWDSIIEISISIIILSKRKKNTEAKFNYSKEKINIKQIA